MFLDEAAKAKTMIHQSFPELSIEHIEFAGEGRDSRSFFVNNTYVFRFPKFPKVAKDLEIEIALLPKLRKYVHTPIPELQFIGRSSDGILLFVGYRKIEGIPLQELWHDLGADVQERILRMLGVFLREVHSFPVAEARNCGVDGIWIGVDRNDRSMKEWALGTLKRQIQEMRGGNFY